MPDLTDRHALELPLGNENVTRANYRALIEALDNVIPTGAEVTTPGELADALAAYYTTAEVDVIVNALAAAAVLKTLFDANTMLKADADDTPEAFAIGEDTIVGRLAGGEIAALTVAQVRTLLEVVRSSLINAAGDIFVGTADNTVGILSLGDPLEVLRVNAAGDALEYGEAAGGASFVSGSKWEIGA
jgi:hypothetical protein